MTLLRAENLTVALGGLDILHGVSFAVGPGEVVGLIGPNGAGKTTLLRALAGLIPAGNGTVYLQDRPFATHARDARARLLAYLAQGGDSQWAVAVETVVALGRLAHTGPWRGLTPVDHAAVERAMAACDVGQFRDRPITKLSGGERGRVMLARVLAGEPRAVLADEPVAGLDPAHQIDAMALLRQLAHDGVGVAVVTHDLTHAVRFCDRLALLHDGRIEAEGPPSEVLTPETIARCYGVRAHLGAVEGQNFVLPLDRT